MNINQISKGERVLALPESPVVSRGKTSSPPPVDWPGSEALNRALEKVPNVRLDRVEELRVATTSLHYPPGELIRGISRLIAEQLTETEN